MLAWFARHVTTYPDLTRVHKSTKRILNAKTKCGLTEHSFICTYSLLHSLPNQSFLSLFLLLHYSHEPSYTCNLQMEPFQTPKCHLWTHRTTTCSASSPIRCRDSLHNHNFPLSTKLLTGLFVHKLQWWTVNNFPSDNIKIRYACEGCTAYSTHFVRIFVYTARYIN
jgi:hypothetical protein